MMENIVLGIAQGLAEWLPVSSEGILVLIKTNFFANQETWQEAIRQALFLHLGSFLAALVYFRQDALKLFQVVLERRKAKLAEKKLIDFLILTTIITGAVGLVAFKLLGSLENQIEMTGRVATMLIGLLLLFTGWMQIKARKGRQRKTKDITDTDTTILGLAQGVAVLPGLSRSGLTVSGLLLRGFKSDTALKLSFLMSMPVILGGNIVLNFGFWGYSKEMLIGALISFVVSLITIDLMLKLARRVNFGYFVIIFGLLVVGSAFV